MCFFPRTPERCTFSVVCACTRIHDSAAVFWGKPFYLLFLSVCTIALVNYTRCKGRKSVPCFRSIIAPTLNVIIRLQRADVCVWMYVSVYRYAEHARLISISKQLGRAGSIGKWNGFNEAAIGWDLASSEQASPQPSRVTSKGAVSLKSRPIV